MLKCERMYEVACRNTARVGLAFLLIIPTTIVFSASLREEALGYRTKGYEAQQRGDQAGALSYYQKAAALDPSYPTPHNDIGIILEALGRLEEAEREYQQALSIEPSFLEAHANLAMLYERSGNKEKAIYHWLKRYQLGDPDDIWTIRAEDRLAALGVIDPSARIKGARFARRRVVEHTFEENAKSIEEFHAVSKKHGDWP